MIAAELPAFSGPRRAPLRRAASRRGTAKRIPDVIPPPRAGDRADHLRNERHRFDRFRASLQGGSSASSNRARASCATSRPVLRAQAIELTTFETIVTVSIASEGVPSHGES